MYDEPPCLSMVVSPPLHLELKCLSCNHQSPVCMIRFRVAVQPAGRGHALYGRDAQGFGRRLAPPRAAISRGAKRGRRPLSPLVRKAQHGIGGLRRSVGSVGSSSRPPRTKAPFHPCYRVYVEFIFWWLFLSLPSVCRRCFVVCVCADLLCVAVVFCGLAMRCCV